MCDALDGVLHGPNVIQSRSCEKYVDFIHLLKECVNGIVTVCLLNNCLQLID